MPPKALFITSNAGVEHDELIKPLEFLQSKGIETIHAAQEQKAVHTVKGDQEAGPTYTPQTTMNKVNPEDYDILIIAGGTVNADLLRIDEAALKIIQHFTDQSKPIAAICHAPWVLINAQRIQNKTLTSYKSIRLDLEHAGAHWVNEAVHRCENDGWVLITSRCPDDLPDYKQAILNELEGIKKHPNHI